MPDNLVCQSCGEPTINELYLGMILCDTCTANLDWELEKAIREEEDLFVYELEL